ncbi:hypothetical protein N7474_002900 [Penicillium riverlandense]|uniref:uncharacterized protein n=1 Tax=Penicillium riverlandense TaxID=1903569 RepID=UPI002547BE06|nr:uncharacterized protein N7474_002900 [Penicillium riverlandense]KAJ5825762.1 hypothetical protein N7474_002900 [Penicillium riverlandense]
MDAFSVAAGTLSIVQAAVQSINTLIHDINAIKDAPTVIKDLRSELAAVRAILTVLDDARKDSKLDALNPAVIAALQVAVASCETACDRFGAKLKRWTRHSEDRVHWRDRVRVGLFAEATIEALRKQLGCCKSTVNMAVGTAALLTSAASNPITDTIKRGLRERELAIEQDIMEIDKQDEEREMVLQEVTRAQPTDNNNNDPSEVVEQLEDQRAALGASRKVLEDLRSETHQMRTGQRITKVEMSDGGKLLVGLINVDDGDGEIRQEIHDIKATTGGKGVVGRIKGFDVNAFFAD